MVRVQTAPRPTDVPSQLGIRGSLQGRVEPEIGHSSLALEGLSSHIFLPLLLTSGCPEPPPCP